MPIVYCFSGSGHSLAVAKALSRLLACKMEEIGFHKEKAQQADVAAVVFPVYCQNIPGPVKLFLKQLRAKHIVLIATYGKLSYGRVLYEAQKLVQGDIIAGAYIPMGHTFLGGDKVFDEKYLLPIVERITAPKKVYIPKTRKELWADFFPALRSRIGVKLTKGDACNHCGLCEKSCPMGAIRNGRVFSECIRCLRCVTICPQNAIQHKNSRILDQYLKSDCKEEYVLYL